MSVLDDLHAAARGRHRGKLEHARGLMARWQARHAAKLETMHPDVSLEVRSLVMDRFLAGIEGGLSDKDLEHARMRVASRLRVKRYGACDDSEETGRQLRECLAALGGTEQQAAA